MIDLIKDLIKNLWPEKRSHRIVVTAVGLLVLWFLSGIFSFTFEDDERQEKTLMRVKVREYEAKERTPISRVSGFTEEQRVVDLRAETQGQVIELVGKKGKEIKQGDVLVKLSLDDRRSKLEEARALVEQRKLEYDVAQKLEKKAFRSKTNVADAKAKYESALASLEAIETSIKDTKILAPFDGIMETNYVEVGSYVKEGDNVIKVVDLDPIKVVAFISEKDLCCVEIGKSVDVILSTGKTIQGVMTYSSMVADENTRTFRIEVDIENKDHELRAGMTAEVLIPLHAVKAHLISSALLMLNDEGVLGVHTVNAENVVEFYPVSIISHEGGAIWVTGLPEKVNLITVGQEFVTVDQQVDPLSEEGVMTNAEIN